MKKAPYSRNENPDEIREIILKNSQRLKEIKLIDGQEQEKKELINNIEHELDLCLGRIDQKNLKQLITEAIKNLKNNRIKFAINYLDLASSKFADIYIDSEGVHDLVE